MVDTRKSRVGQGSRTWVVLGLFERWGLEC